MQLPDLGEIARERRKLGLTQADLAVKAGVSQSLIARIEAGTVDPRYSNVVGVFTALDELKGREVAAREIMTKNVVGLQVDNTMEKAAAKMKEKGVSQMPVFDGDSIVGSISEKTILDQIARGVDGKTLSNEKVSAYMDAAFPTVNPETPLSVLSALLEYNTAVIVQDKGATKGIITNADLLKMIHK